MRLGHRAPLVVVRWIVLARGGRTVTRVVARLRVGWTLGCRLKLRCHVLNTLIYLPEESSDVEVDSGIAGLPTNGIKCDHFLSMEEVLQTINRFYTQHFQFLG